jgi:hypothetical protein
MAFCRMPWLLRTTSFAKQDAKRSHREWHHYTWPNFDGAIRPNCLSIRTGRGYRIRNARAALRQSLKGRLDYLELPGVYLGGFAEYETLNRLIPSP